MSGLRTPQEFTLPLKIELRVKTNEHCIVMRYAHGTISLTDTGDPHGLNNSILFWPLEGGEWRVHENCSSFPKNEFVDIEYIFGRDICSWGGYSGVKSLRVTEF